MTEDYRCYMTYDCSPQILVAKKNADTLCWKIAVIWRRQSFHFGRIEDNVVRYRTALLKRAMLLAIIHIGLAISELSLLR